MGRLVRYSTKAWLASGRKPRLTRFGAMPVLEWGSGLWRLDPVLTELTVYRELKVDPPSVVSTYVAVPWTLLIQAEAVDAFRLPCVAGGAFTVCQHIDYRTIVPGLIAAGVRCLFTPHVDGEMPDIDLRPMPIFPVNGVPPAKNKDILYSFIGCNHLKVLDSHGEWVANETRSRVLRLPARSDAVIVERPHWHFSSRLRQRWTNEYRDVLARSRFSLCPRGTGPNSIRLWESLQAGAIPILLSDHLRLPEVTGIDWDKCLLRIPERDTASLDERIRAIDAAQEERLRHGCIEAFRKLASPGFFSAAVRAGLECL